MPRPPTSHQQAQLAPGGTFGDPTNALYDRAGAFMGRSDPKVAYGGGKAAARPAGGS